MNIIAAAFADHARVMSEAAAGLPATLERVAAELHACFERGNKLLACGNGGSAADVEHLVAELVGRYREERRGLPALALVTGSATVTALANDYGYERVFARQVEALARPGDLLFAISTSGKSPNVLAAAGAARALGCTVVGFTGANPGPLGAAADLVLSAPSLVTARIQEVHAISIHIICECIDALLQGGGAR
ncbi:MAG TPA: SIS domain-containing protein [Steroidobacteraceae bacterium]|nr:SIS domain-containing protein [Steroidobacteraceae bacterium]